MADKHGTEENGQSRRENNQDANSTEKPKVMLEGLQKKSTSIKLNIGQKRKHDIEQILKKEPKSVKGPSKVSSGVSLAFTSKQEKEKNESNVQEKKGSVAKAFGDDSDSEEEEMPKEARMRMRNMGRETPTSAGPNSYNKGKQGFINRSRLWDREMKPRIHLEKPPDK